MLTEIISIIYYSSYSSCELNLVIKAFIDFIQTNWFPFLGKKKKNNKIVEHWKAKKMCEAFKQDHNLHYRNAIAFALVSSLICIGSADNALLLSFKSNFLQHVLRFALKNNQTTFSTIIIYSAVAKFFTLSTPNQMVYGYYKSYTGTRNCSPWVKYNFYKETL